MNFLKASLISMVLVTSHIASADEFEKWMGDYFEVSISKLLDNINPKGSIPGTVIASPSKQKPNYYYHWVRDASLVMRTVSRLHSIEKDPIKKEIYLNYLKDYVVGTKIHHSYPSKGGLGEVKFYVDGRPFQGPWGRPQNDGPGLRSMVMIQFANYLLDNGEEDYVRRELYNVGLPATTVIKKDLEYVSHRWTQKDFDLWEEVVGHHFFTRMAQRRALLQGAKLARRLGDDAAAFWYDDQAFHLGRELNYHWDESWGIFLSTINWGGHRRGKGGMDSATILGVVYTHVDGEKQFDLSDDRFLSTLERTRKRFARVYKINELQPGVGTAIGRYPEDTYDGYKTDALGNPWFLTTAGFANYCYRLASNMKNKKSLRLTEFNIRFVKHVMLSNGHGFNMDEDAMLKGKSLSNFKEALIQSGDSYLRRVRLHIDENNSMSEQINRRTGFMQGARDLTWSYSSFIDAYLSRKEAVK